VERGGVGCYCEPKEGCKEELGTDGSLWESLRLYWLAVVTELTDVMALVKWKALCILIFSIWVSSVSNYVFDWILLKHELCMIWRKAKNKQSQRFFKPAEIFYFHDKNEQILKNSSRSFQGEAVPDSW
jgi:hypothetical protein